MKMVSHFPQGKAENCRYSDRLLAARRIGEPVPNEGHAGKREKGQAEVWT